MTYSVKINVKPSTVLPDIFDWLEANNMHHVEHWRWFRPDRNTNYPTDQRYSFDFDKEEHAVMFALRWS